VVAIGLAIERGRRRRRHFSTSRWSAPKYFSGADVTFDRD